MSQQVDGGLGLDAAAEVQKLGRFLREEFRDGAPLRGSAVEEAIRRLNDLKLIADGLSDEEREAARERGAEQQPRLRALRRLKGRAADGDDMKSILKRFEAIFGGLFGNGTP